MSFEKKACFMSKCYVMCMLYVKISTRNFTTKKWALWRADNSTRRLDAPINPILIWKLGVTRPTILKASCCQSYIHPASNPRKAITKHVMCMLYVKILCCVHALCQFFCLRRLAIIFRNEWAIILRKWVSDHFSEFSVSSPRPIILKWSIIISRWVSDHFSEKSLYSV